MNIKEHLEHSEKILKEAKISSAHLDSLLLMAFTLGVEKKNLLTHDKNLLTELRDDESQRFLSLIEKRCEGWSVAALVGEKAFYKYDFIVDSNVLIPRPETELVVEKALDHFSKSKKLNILDMGSGSGCIGLTLALELKNSRVTLVEKSEKAIEVTRQNIEKYDLFDRTSAICGSAVEQEFKEKFELIVANPPYIKINDKSVQKSVAKFEPKEALYSGKKGTEHIEAWSMFASENLIPGGVFVTEIGYDQGEVLSQTFASQKSWSQITLYNDLAGLNRVFVLIKEG